MRRMVLILMVAAAAALAQNPTKKISAAVPAKAAGGAAHSASKRKIVAPSDALITIHGMCDGAQQTSPGSKASACTKVITRQEFEAFMDALNSTMTRGIDPIMYRNAAEGYAALLVTSDAAQKAGADKDPRFEQILEITRLRALGGMYRSHKYKEALQVPAEEIEADYKKNIAGYEEVDLDRFLLPKNNPMNLSDEAFSAKSKRLAEEMRERAVKGEDVDKLEKEGLEALGEKQIPGTAIGVRRGQIEENADKAIFALRQGEVTPVLDERALWMFFKRTGRKTLSLEMVEPEIRTKLFRDKLDMIDKNLHDAVHVDYNEAYFGPSPTAPKPAAGDSAKAAETKKAEGNSTGAAALAPSDPVLTIHGLCGSHKLEAAASSCTMTVTKEQFETIVKLTVLTASKTAPSSPRNIAEGYLDVLIYGEAGERAGMEKDAHYASVMELSRKRALNDLYRLKVDEEAYRIPAETIEAYYKKHVDGFEEVRLTHISIPREQPATSQVADFEAKAKRLASQIRERAVKGEDVEKLQKEVYETLGLKNPPEVAMSPIRKGSLEEGAEREVYSLKPGEITSVRAFPPAYVIYRLDSRRTIPLEEARAEISNLLYREKLEKLTKAVSESIRTEYNEAYFQSVKRTSWTSAGTQASVSQERVSPK